MRVLPHDQPNVHLFLDTIPKYKRIIDYIVYSRGSQSVIP